MVISYLIDLAFKRRLFFLFVLNTCLLWPSQAQAWDFAGHFTVATLAYQQLNSNAKKEADRLVQILKTAEPAVAHFVPASVWLDAQNWNPDFSLMQSWHYVDQPYPADSQWQGKGNLIEISHSAIKTLCSSRSTDFQKALMLRVILHTVADLHQPLHTIEYLQNEFPRGDRGGHDFHLQGQFADLHALWDAAGGQFPYLRINQWQSALPLAQALHKDYPALSLAQSKLTESNLSQWPEQWALESYALGIDAYQGIQVNTVPTESYLSKVQLVSRKQLAHAAYRLADVLNVCLAKR